MCGQNNKSLISGWLPVGYLAVSEDMYVFQMQVAENPADNFGRLICSEGHTRSGRWSAIERKSKCPKCQQSEKLVFPPRGYLLVGDDL